MQQVSIPVNEICEYNIFHSETQICAGDMNLSDPKDSCQGDSGGPFVQRDLISGQWHISGIVSYGSKCGGGGVYTRVTAYENWIRDTISTN